MCDRHCFLAWFWRRYVVPMTRVDRAASTTSSVMVVISLMARMRPTLVEQALEQAEVAAGDARDGGDGAVVGEVVGVEREAELLQWRRSTKVSSSPWRGRYSWAKPTRL